MAVCVFCVGDIVMLREALCWYAAGIDAGASVFGVVVCLCVVCVFCLFVFVVLCVCILV